jgi:glycosyltransferase involved in cell wall biosynthesis
MRIAQISPLYESVPPKLYGGTERIVSYLTEELVRQGHEVTLFASGDSLTSAHLLPCSPTATRLSRTIEDPLAYHMLMMGKVARMAKEFDILHFHTDYLHFPTFRYMAERTVTTLHGRLDLPDLPSLYADFREMPVVSISERQRRPLPHANWAGTVLHGLPKNLLPFQPQHKGYLAFLGRISPEKRPDRAIEIAIRTGIPLRIAAKISKEDQAYFDTVVKPRLNHPLIEFVGEINERQKADFLGNALALLFPIDWPEPFGLVMIEAMSCGTPVIAWPNGAVPEVIDHGISGYHVTSIEEAVRAVEACLYSERQRVRQAFEARFTTRRMAKDYIALYKAALGGRDAPAASAPAAKTGLRTPSPTLMQPA